MNVGDLALVTYDKGGYNVKDCLVVITQVWGTSYRFLSPTVAQGNVGQTNCQWSLPEPYLKPYIPAVGDEVVVVKQMRNFDPNLLPDTLRHIGKIENIYPIGGYRLRFLNNFWSYNSNSVVPANLTEEHVDVIVIELAKLGKIVAPPTPRAATIPKVKYRCINSATTEI